jgi:damage-control phosphatase, subfamily I
MERCKQCLLGSIKQLEKQYALSKKQMDWLQEKLDAYISGIKDTTKMPTIAAELHQILREVSGINNPYKKEKDISNTVALKMYDSLLEKTISSKDPWLEALKLSIAGNIMDYVSVPNLSGNEEKYFLETLEKLFHSGIVSNDIEKLRNAISKANNILFLGDNAGEIVMDKLFLRILQHTNITYVVRGDYILNDVTFEDAKLVGIDKYAQILSNGNNAPSTIIEHTSNEFKGAYKKADIIISKGQGNYEGLMNEKDNRIFFLLMAKCEVIAEKLNVKLKDVVVKQQII